MVASIKQRFDVKVVGLGAEPTDTYTIHGVFHVLQSSRIPTKDLDVFKNLVLPRKDMEGVVIEGNNIQAKIVTFHFKRERESVWEWINKIQDTSFNKQKTCLWSQFQLGRITQRQFTDGLRMYLSIHKMTTPFDIIQHKIVEQLLEDHK